MTGCGPIVRDVMGEAMLRGIEICKEIIDVLKDLLLGHKGLTSVILQECNSISTSPYERRGGIKRCWHHLLASRNSEFHEAEFLFS